MKVGYARVSSIEQNEERQMKILQDVGCERIYLDKCSGKDTNRPKLQEMLNFLREGDILYVDDLSRLGRSTKDLLNIIDTLEKEKIKFVS